MANDGGITQYIRLLLDQRSVDQVIKSAKETGQEAGKALASGLSNDALIQKEVHELAIKLRAAAEQQLSQIGKQVAEGILSESAAAVQGEKVGSAYRKALKQALSVLGSEQRGELGELLKFDPAELGGAPKLIAEALGNAIRSAAPGLITASEEVGQQAVQAIAKGIKESPTASINKALAEKVKAAQQGLYNALQLVQARGPQAHDQFSIPEAGALEAQTRYAQQVEQIFAGSVGAEKLKTQAFAILSDIPKLMAESLKKGEANLGPVTTEAQHLGQAVTQQLEVGMADALKESVGSLKAELNQELQQVFDPKEQVEVVKEFQANLSGILREMNLAPALRQGIEEAVKGLSGSELEAALNKLIDPLTKAAPALVEPAAQAVATDLVNEIAQEMIAQAPKVEQAVEAVVEKAQAKVKRRAKGTPPPVEEQKQTTQAEQQTANAAEQEAAAKRQQVEAEEAEWNRQAAINRKIGEAESARLKVEGEAYKKRQAARDQLNELATSKGLTKAQYVRQQAERNQGELEVFGHAQDSNREKGLNPLQHETALDPQVVFKQYVEAIKQGTAQVTEATEAANKKQAKINQDQVARAKQSTDQMYKVVGQNLQEKAAQQKAADEKREAESLALLRASEAKKKEQYLKDLQAFQEAETKKVQAAKEATTQETQAVPTAGRVRLGPNLPKRGLVYSVGPQLGPELPPGGIKQQAAEVVKDIAQATKQVKQAKAEEAKEITTGTEQAAQQETKALGDQTKQVEAQIAKDQAAIIDKLKAKNDKVKEALNKVNTKTGATSTTPAQVEQSVVAAMRQSTAALDKMINDMLKEVSSGSRTRASASAAADELIVTYNQGLQRAVTQLGKNIGPVDRTELLKKLSVSRTDFIEGFKQAEAAGKQLIKAVNAGAKQEAPTVQATVQEVQESLIERLRNRIKDFFKLGEDEGKSWAQGLRDALRPVALGDEPTLTKGQDLSLRAIARKKNPNDSLAANIAYKESLDKIRIAGQLESSTLTNLGKVLNALGIDAYKADKQFSDLELRLKNLSTSGKQATGGMSAFGFNLGNIAQFARQAAYSLGLYYGAYQVIQFGKESLKAVAEQEASWARLTNALNNYGITLAATYPEIQKTIEANKKLGFNTKESLEMLGTLVELTGDYKKSLQGVGIVMDLMVNRHMTEEQASRMVSRAILGDIQLFTRYGIVLDQTRDIMEQLQNRLGGGAVARMNTLEGATKRLSVAWYDFKVAVGETLKEAGGGVGTLDQVSAVLKTMGDLIRQNVEFFSVLAFLLKAVGLFLVGVVIGLGTMTKVLFTAFDVILSVIKAVGPGSRLAAAQFGDSFLAALNLIAKAMDQVFHTHFGNSIKSMQAQLKKFGADAQAELDKINNGVSDRAFNRFLPPGPIKPDVVDSVINDDPEKVRSSTAHRIVNQEVSKLGRIATTPTMDPELRLKAEQDLDKILQQQKAHLDDLKSDDKDILRNKGEILETENTIANILRIQAKIEKQKNDDAAQRRRDAEEMRQIELHKRIAESSNETAARKAMEWLVNEHHKLEEILARQPLWGKRYWIVADQIRAVEDARLQIMQKQDQHFAKQVGDLHKRLELHVDEGEAEAELRRILADINAQIAVQTVMEKLGITNEQDKLILYERQHAVLMALNTTNDEREQKIQHFIELLRKPSTHDEGERNLLDIRAALIRKMYDEKTVGEELVTVRKQIEEIDSQIKENADNRVSDLRKELTAARELFRIDEARAKTHKRVVPGTHGKEHEDVQTTSHGHSGHGSLEDREKAEQLYEDVIQKAKEDLAKLDEEGVKDNKTLAKRAELIGIIATAEKELYKIREPSLNIPKDFKDVFHKQLPQMAQDAAASMADSMVLMFEKLGVSISTIRQSLLAMPKGLGKAMLKELAEMAKGKAKEHLAWSISEIALGIGRLAHFDAPGAALHFLSAGKHILAATAWGAVGGAAASGGGGGAGGDRSGGTGDNADRKEKGQATIYITGGILSTDDYRQMDALAKALQAVEGRDVVIRRG